MEYDHGRPDEIDFDRKTALMVLKDLSKNMRPREDMFGRKILAISRDAFEEVRKKYLDKEKGEKK